MGKRFYNQARKVARLSAEFLSEKRRFDDAFEERYGIHYSDIDEDWLIDCFDYGGGGLPTLERMDEMMAENGYPAKS